MDDDRNKTIDFGEFKIGILTYGLSFSDEVQGCTTVYVYLIPLSTYK